MELAGARDVVCFVFLGAPLRSESVAFWLGPLSTQKGRRGGAGFTPTSPRPVDRGGLFYLDKCRWYLNTRSHAGWRQRETARGSFRHTMLLFLFFLT